jgi:hypothetical protein
MRCTTRWCLRACRRIFGPCFHLDLAVPTVSYQYLVHFVACSGLEPESPLGAGEFESPVFTISPTGLAAVHSKLANTYSTALVWHEVLLRVTLSLLPLEAHITTSPSSSQLNSSPKLYLPRSCRDVDELGSLGICSRPDIAKVVRILDLHTAGDPVCQRIVDPLGLEPRSPG